MAASAIGDDGRAIHLRLLDGFELRHGRRLLGLPNHAQRVLAYLAVNDRAHTRPNLARRLWMDTTDQHSGSSLRTALWRIRRLGSNLIEDNGGWLTLGRCVDVDYRRSVRLARSLITRDSGIADRDLITAPLETDLLPDWDEDWVLFERERLRQLRIHALEALAHRLIARGEIAAAIEAGLAAVAAEPLRETAHVTVIDAHLAEHNVSEARRQYESYATLLRQELGCNPSPVLTRRVTHRQALLPPRPDAPTSDRPTAVPS